MIEEGAYQHVLPGEASVDERGDVPEDSSSASVGLFRGPEHVDELVHEGRHRPAAAPPRALGVSSARGRHLGLFSPETPPRLLDRPVARLPRRLFALRTERAREQTRRSPFERPTAGGCRPSVADPAPLTRGFSQPRRQDPAVHLANGWSLSAPSPRAPAARCPSFAGLPSPGSCVLSGKGHSASNRRSKRPSPLTTLPAASLHRILIAGCCKVQVSPLCGGRSSVGIFFRDIIANVNMSTRF